MHQTHPGWERSRWLLVSNLHPELIEEEMSRAKGCLGAASVLALLFGVAGWLLR